MLAWVPGLKSLASCWLCGCPAAALLPPLKPLLLSQLWLLRLSEVISDVAPKELEKALVGRMLQAAKRRGKQVCPLVLTSACLPGAQAQD